MKIEKETNLLLRAKLHQTMPKELVKVHITSIISSNHYSVAMLKRSKKQDNSMMQYYYVIGAFVVVCVASVVYVLLNPKKPFSSMQVIDES